MEEQTSSSENGITGQPPAEMAPLVFGLYRKGPTWSPASTPQVQQDQRGHLANFQRLAMRGVLLLSGPIPEGDPYRGLILLDCDSVGEAAELMAADPHLKSRRLELDLFPLLIDAQALTRPFKIPLGGDSG